MRSDGSEVPAELAILPIPGIKPPLFTAFLRDITERKRAERELREAAERFRFMADAMPAKVFTTDSVGNFDYFNQLWIEFTGATAADLRRQGWLAFVHPEEQQRTSEDWHRALEHNEPFQSEHRLRRHDGVYRWHLTRAQAFRIDGDRIKMWIGSTADIDDKIREEERLEQLVSERTQTLTELNEQLESFVYAIAHDLRGPLRSIGSFAEILTEDAGESLSPENRNLLNRIRGSAEFMNRLIADLLAFGRTARAQMQLSPVEVRKAWETALAQTASQIEEAQAEVITKAPLPVVSAHGATLGQVFANLLSNAIKFMPQGVRPKIQFWAEERGANVRLWVEDNGIGIPADQHERIFRVFERLHGNQYVGTGIGLSIVRKGIERMGGKVGLESDTGKGTRFWIELPKAA
jgi:PAS domain S-box-containing protein